MAGSSLCDEQPATLRLLSVLLADELPSDALQHIGDALLGVIEPAINDLNDVVDRLIGQLRERQWDGDAELIEALEHGSGRHSSSLKPLPVELDEVGEALSEQPGTENFLDLLTGTVWFHTMTDFGIDDDLDADFSDETRWLCLEGEGSQEAYRDLQRFIGTVGDEELVAAPDRDRRS